MIDELLRIGDRVTITIPKENREWGYNPCPDGTLATVVDFGQIYHGRIYNLGFTPGIYVNRASSKLFLENEDELSLNSGYLELVDQDEYTRRLLIWRQERLTGDWRSQYDRKDDLPETPFWEGDMVRATQRSVLTVITNEFPERDPEIFVITRIDYDHLNDLTDPGTKWPAYEISDKLRAGWCTSANEDDLTLVERGKVWRFYHDEPIEFADIQEEADFFEMLGRTREVKNPANNSYSWTKDDALSAIQQGIAHGFTVRGSGFFAPGISIDAIRFLDEDLGKRVAAATLAGFEVVD